MTAQEIYAKAALVDRAKLAGLQHECRLVEAEECFRGAFWTDVRPIVQEWRVARGLPADPLKALAESGYVEKVTSERSSKNAKSASSYA
jgi:L-rhamnose isomerase/sugar isomerase